MEYLVLTTAQLALVLKKLRKKTAEPQSVAAGRSGLLAKTVSLLENHPERSSVESLMKYISALNLELVLREKPDSDNMELW